MQGKQAALTIGKLAQQVGVGIDTVRYYERAGLLPAAQRTAAGYRVYGEAAVRRMQFIRRARAHGFTLEDTAALLQLSQGGDRAEVRRLAQQRLADIERRLAELQALRDSLAGLVAGCHGHGDVDECPIVASLSPREAKAVAA